MLYQPTSLIYVPSRVHPLQFTDRARSLLSLCQGRLVVSRSTIRNLLTDVIRSIASARLYLCFIIGLSGYILQEFRLHTMRPFPSPIVFSLASAGVSWLLLQIICRSAAVNCGFLHHRAENKPHSAVFRISSDERTWQSRVQKAFQEFHFEASLYLIITFFLQIYAIVLSRILLDVWLTYSSLINVYSTLLQCIYW